MVCVSINKCEMLSSKFSFSVDVRNKVRYVFARILRRDTIIKTSNAQLLETRKNDSFLCRKTITHSFFSEKWLIDIC